MLMNFSSKKKTAHVTQVLFPGRTGHRAARINDSIFVLGGTDKSGKFISQVHRINCLNNRIDSLILENTISIEGFSLFSYQENLYIWGGLRFKQHVNHLLQFDGTKFIPIKQEGNVPAPRAFHSFTTFGGKYLIIFAGSNGQSFFNDWNLLNLKTMQWKSLSPSVQIKYNLGCTMVWSGGRGILLVNQLFDEQSKSIISNSFYEFYVNDYNNDLLNIQPLQICTNNGHFKDYIFNHMTVSDKNSILIFGGYHAHSHTQFHNLSYILYLDHYKLEKAKFKSNERSEFESIYYKNKLYIIGGLISKNEMEQYTEIYDNNHQKCYFKRNVCTICKLYFDQQWQKSSKEVYPISKIRQQYDYNYHLRIDNRILAKFSTYITSDLYALTLILQSLRNLTLHNIEVSFHKFKQNYSALIPEMVDQTYPTLRVLTTISQIDSNLIVNELLMLRQRKCKEHTIDYNIFELSLLKLKISCFRLGSSALITIKTGKQEFCIIYFSCMQIQCTHSNYCPFSNYHYYYNTKTKQFSSKNNRHIIYENVKHIIKNISQYQDIGQHTISIVIFCRQNLQNQLISFQQNWDAETGQTGPINQIDKQQNRKPIPLLQFSFLPMKKYNNIFIEQYPINFINILQLLSGDARNMTLQKIQKFDQINFSNIFQKIELYNYPSEYWFKRLLIYHSNRLIMHWQENSINICGVIIIRQQIQLDLSGNKLAFLQDEIKIKDIIKQLKGLKRNRIF